MNDMEGIKKILLERTTSTVAQTEEIVSRMATAAALLKKNNGIEISDDQLISMANIFNTLPAHKVVDLIVLARESGKEHVAKVSVGNKGLNPKALAMALDKLRALKVGKNIDGSKGFSAAKTREMNKNVSKKGMDI